MAKTKTKNGYLVVIGEETFVICESLDEVREQFDEYGIDNEDQVEVYELGREVKCKIEVIEQDPEIEVTFK